MNYTYIMSPPHRLATDQSMKFTRHVYGCPESHYGIEYEPTDEDLLLDPPRDCTCVTGAPGSPVAALDAGDTPAHQPPLVPSDGHDGRRGGQPGPSGGAAAAAIQAQIDEAEQERMARSEAPFDDIPEEIGSPRPSGWRAALLSWQGTFEFMVDMRKRAADPAWTPTERQLAAIEKCLVREGKPPQQEESRAEGISIAPLGDFRYAVEQPNGTYYAVVISTGKGKWDNWRFVMGKLLPDGEIERLGRQKPGESYSGSHQRDLVTVLSDPDGALDQYYEATDICPVCFKRHDPPRCS